MTTQGNNKRLRRDMRSAAFTLVELLVVVGGIGLLCAQVVPLMRNLREDTTNLSCQDKLGRIVRASMAYSAEDADEQAIPIAVIDALYVNTRYSYYAYGGKSGQGRIGSSLAWGGYAGIGGYAGMASMHRPLNRILYKDPVPGPTSSRGGYNWTRDGRLDLDVYHCPGDTGFPGMHHQEWQQGGMSSYDHYGTSYAAVPFFVKDWLDPQYYFSNSVYQRQLSAVPNPANTLMYWENAARHAIYSDNPDAQEPYSLCGPWYGPEYVANGWHGAPWRFNAAFADGGVRNIFVRGYVDRTAEIEEVDWCGHENDRCICVVVRGDGWQLDTLPAPFIRTNKETNASDAGSAIVP